MSRVAAASKLPPVVVSASSNIATNSATYFFHQEGAGFSSILDTAGNDWINYNVAEGTAGGDPVELPAGTYSVKVLTSPLKVFETVKVEWEKETELTVE